MVRYVRFYTRWTRRENDQFSTLRCTKTGSTQPKLSAACFVVQSCLVDADFVVFSNYCLIGTRQSLFFLFGWGGEICKERSDGIAFCSTKNFINLAKRVTPGQLKRNFQRFGRKTPALSEGIKKNSRINICDCFLYLFGWGGEI